MDKSGAAGGFRTQRWRWVAVFLLLAVAFLIRPPAGATQTIGDGDRQDRLCDRLEQVLDTVGTRGSARQALLTRLERLGCPARPGTTTTTTTTTSLPGPSTTITSSSIPGTTTTTTHLDCPLPGGGVGPCPTTTTLVIPPTTSSTLPDGTTLPTTTLPPCPSTTIPSTTTTTTIPTTTIPTCMP